MPLQTGNKWYYVSYSGNIPDTTKFDKMLEVTEKISFSGNIFYKIAERKYFKKYPLSLISKEDHYLGMAVIDSFFYCLDNDTLWKTSNYQIFNKVKEIPEAVFRSDDTEFLIIDKKGYINGVNDIRTFPQNKNLTIYKRGAGRYDDSASWGIRERLVNFALSTEK